jgi:hypothetical protein
MLGGILGIVCTHVPVIGPPAAFILTKLSVNEAFVKVNAFGFVNVSVTVEVPPVRIVVGLNALVMVGLVEAKTL